jgi:hypothetical protein
VAQRRRPATIADIDLGALAGRMAAVTEKAAQDDPAALRRKIAELERERKRPAQVAALRAEVAELRAREPERVEVPVLMPGDCAAVEQVVTGIRDLSGELATVASRLEAALARARTPERSTAAQTRRPAPERIPAPRNAWPRTVPDPADPAGLASMPAPDVPALSKAQRAILTVLAQFPDGRTKRQVGMLTGYSTKGGGFNNALGALRTSGLIERGEPITATDAGLAALGNWEPLPEGPALIDHWMGQLGKAEGLVLRAVLDAYPASLTKDEIAAATGYAAGGGGFNNALGRLRTLQLIDGSRDIRADETLAGAAFETAGGE